MKPTFALISVPRSQVVRTAAGIALSIAIGAVAAQSATTAPSAPPLARPATGASAPAVNAPTNNAPAATSTKPTYPPPARQRIELSPAEVQAIERSNAASTAPTRPDDGLVPTAADLTAPPIDDRQTRIEQVRTSNRVSEVIVTPAIGAHSFVMTNRDGRQPLTQTDMGGGLSVPKFFRWEFGGPAPAPLAVPPPPPTR